MNSSVVRCVCVLCFVHLFVSTAGTADSHAGQNGRTLGNSTAIDLEDAHIKFLFAANGSNWDSDMSGLQPGYEQLFINISCERIIGAKVKIGLLVHGVNTIDFMRRGAQSCIAKALDIDDALVEMEIHWSNETKHVAILSVFVHVRSDETKKSLTQILSKLRSWSDHGKLGDALREAGTVNKHGGDVRVQSVSVPRFRTEKCESQVTAAARTTFESGTNSTSYANTSKNSHTASGSNAARVSFDSCASAEVYAVDVVSQSTHQSRSARLAIFTATAMAVDTKPYRVLCPGESLKRTGHSLTRVGPRMIMFGGLTVEHGSSKTKPTSDLWALEETKDGSNFQWVSLDRKYNIFIRPRARYGHAAAAFTNGLYVIYGGHSKSEYLRDIWTIGLGSSNGEVSAEDSFPLYRWRECFTVHPPPASFMSSTAVVAHKTLAMFGGQRTAGALTNTLWLLDQSQLTPRRVQWRQITPFKTIAPAPRFGHSVCFVEKRPRIALSGVRNADLSHGQDTGGLLVFGGIELDFDAIVLRNDLWFFDFYNVRWVALELGQTFASEYIPHKAKRPPPLGFHSAQILGPAMVIVGGVSKTRGPGYEVRTEVWRWMDGQGWALQFEAPPADGMTALRKFSAGAMSYWPSAGKLILYGGLEDADALEFWTKSVLEMQRRQSSPGAPVPEYLPPLFSGQVIGSVLKDSVLLIEGEACADAWDKDTGQPARIAPVCFPCHSGASYITDKMATGDSKTVEPGNAPWISPGAPRCEPCGAGTIYSDGACRPCPPGFYGPYRGMESWTMCWPCRALQFSAKAGSQSCTPCIGPDHKPNATEEHAKGEHSDGDNRDREHDDEHTHGGQGIQKCPMYAESNFERLSYQKVREHNEPHGKNFMKDHVWWQQFGLSIWATVVPAGLLLLILFQARKPRFAAQFMRRFDMRPITASAVPTEAGGIVFMAYVVTCTCAALIGIAYHMLNNAQLTSMSVPSEEEFGRIGHIEVKLQISTTLRGYMGPCLRVDDDDDENAAKVDYAGEQYGDQRIFADGIVDGRLLSDESPADGDNWTRYVAPSGDSPHGVHVEEHFAAEGPAVEISHHRSYRTVESKSGRHIPPHLNLPLHTLDPEVRPRVLPQHWWRGPAALGKTQSIERQRRLEESRVTCHDLIRVSASGIDLGKDEFKIHCERLEPRTCRVAFSCDKCSIGKEKASYGLSVKAGRAFTAAREILWSVRADWLQPAWRQAKAYSSVESLVTTGRLDTCLRGPRPSVVRMTVEPTDYHDYIGHFHLYGLVTQFIDATIGSTASATTFHQEPAELNTLLEFQRSHSLYKLVLSRKSTAFDFLAQMLGFLSGMSLIARVLVALWNNLSESVRSSCSCISQNFCIKGISGILCFCVPEELDEDSVGPNGYKQVGTQSPPPEPGGSSGSNQSDDVQSGLIQAEPGAIHHRSFQPDGI